MTNIQIARKLHFYGAEKTFAENNFLLTSYHGLRNNATQAIKEGIDDPSTGP